MKGQKSLHPAGSVRFADEKIVDVSHGRFSVSAGKKVVNVQEPQYQNNHHQNNQQGQTMMVNGIRTQVRFQDSVETNVITPTNRIPSQGDYQYWKSDARVNADGQPFNYNGIYPHKNGKHINRSTLQGGDDVHDNFRGTNVVAADNAPYGNVIPRQVVPQVNPNANAQDRAHWGSSNTVYSEAQPFRQGQNPRQNNTPANLGLSGLNDDARGYLKGRTVVQGYGANGNTGNSGGNYGHHPYGDNQNPGLDRKARDQMISKMEQLRQYQASRPGQHLFAQQSMPVQAGGFVQRGEFAYYDVNTESHNVTAEGDLHNKNDGVYEGTPQNQILPDLTAATTTTTSTPNCPTGSSRDCAGVCGGKSILDCAGNCYNPTTGGKPTKVKDCAGVCGGTAAYDCAGVCKGKSILDCAGKCYLPPAKPANTLDCAGTCTGPDKPGVVSKVPGCDGKCGSNAVLGCDGVCASGATVDCAGVCKGTATPDCLGVCGGKAQYDCAGVCFDSLNGGPANVQGCNSDCGKVGTISYLDCGGNCIPPSCQVQTFRPKAQSGHHHNDEKNQKSVVRKFTNKNA